VVKKVCSDLKAVKEMISPSHIAITDRDSDLTLSHKRLLQNMVAEHYSDSRKKVWYTYGTQSQNQ